MDRRQGRVSREGGQTFRVSDVETNIGDVHGRDLDEFGDRNGGSHCFEEFANITRGVSYGALPASSGRGEKGPSMSIFEPSSFVYYAQIVMGVGWILNVCSTVQLLCRSEADLRRVGRVRRVELILNVIGIVLYFVGAFRGFMWFFDIRRRLAENQAHDAREATLRRREERFAHYMEQTYGR